MNHDNEYYETLKKVIIPDTLHFFEDGQDKLVETIRFAERTGQLYDLQDRLNQLGRVAGADGKIYVSSDFANFSFYWQLYPKDVPMETWQKDWQKYRWMNGGLIYHGQLENGIFEETFSVNLARSDGSNWSIHT